jgi:carbamoyl-phosphate synthase large subunit
LSKAILFTSAGRRIGLMNAMRGSLAELQLDWRILAADAAPELSAACQLADASYRVPRATSDEYVDSLLELCRKEEVVLLVPTIDTELIALSINEPEFAAAGVRVNIGGPEFVQLARDKALTAEKLSALAIATPRTWPVEGTVVGDLQFPAMTKPKGGSSSIGIVRYASPEEYRRNPPGSDCIVQELLNGPEYTVNAFCDSAGSFRCAVPHLRIEVRGGEVSKGRTERRADLIAIAERIAALPGARGVFCFQAILTEAGPVVFEINARFGGGYPLAHRAGAKFTNWLVQEVVGGVCTAGDTWQDGLVMLRYDSEVFVP